MIVIGGYPFEDQKCYILHLKNFTWKSPNEANYMRCGHTANKIKNKIYLFGGEDGKGGGRLMNDLTCLDTIDLYCTEPKTTGKIPPCRRGHGSEVLGNNLFIYGGKLKNHSFCRDLFCCNL